MARDDRDENTARTIWLLSEGITLCNEKTAAFEAAAAATELGVSGREVSSGAVATTREGRRRGREERRERVEAGLSNEIEDRALETAETPREGVAERDAAVARVRGNAEVTFTDPPPTPTPPSSSTTYTKR